MKSPVAVSEKRRPMLPIILDGSRLRAGLAGAGEGFARRLKGDEGGGRGRAGNFFRPPPEPGRNRQAPDPFHCRPRRGHICRPCGRRAGCRRAGQCRGRTGAVRFPCAGAGPPRRSASGRIDGRPFAALSRVLREHLEDRFGPEWDGRLEEIAGLRQTWRAAGAAPNEVSSRTREVLAERGWLA